MSSWPMNAANAARLARVPANTLAFVLAGLMVAAASMSAAAQAWPQRPVKFIVPFGPGAGADISARLIQETLQTRWGKPVVIENRPGGDGLVAISTFVTAADDHVLLYSATGSFTVHPYQHEKLPYDAGSDIVPIARVTNTILAVGVPTADKVDSLTDFVARTKAEPGKMNAALVPGITEFVWDGFVHKNGLKITKVPYRDIVQAGTDLGQGRLQIMMASLAILQPHLQAGTVKLILVNGKSPTDLAKGQPTAAQAGFPEIELDGLVGLLGPKGMTLDLRERISKDVIAAASDPNVAMKLVGSAQVVNPGGPAEFAAAMKGQQEQIDAIARQIGVARKLKP